MTVLSFPIASKRQELEAANLREAARELENLRAMRLAYTGGMRAFMVFIGNRENPRLQFEAMATDSFAYQIQHLDLVRFGEAMRITPIAGEKQG